MLSNTFDFCTLKYQESLLFSSFTYEFFGQCVYQENKSDTRECCITTLYHAIENTVTNPINATYSRRTYGGKVGCNSVDYPAVFLIGCIFYGGCEVKHACIVSCSRVVCN